MRCPEDHGQIEMNPAVLVGKPVIKGTRLSVQLILEHMACGQSIGDLLESYPRLVRDDVVAALQYASCVLGNMRSGNAALSHDHDVDFQ